MINDIRSMYTYIISRLKRVILVGLFLGLIPFVVNGKVVIPAFPSEQHLSLDYEIEVDGLSVPVYKAQTQHHDKKYSFAYFDFSGSVTIKIKSRFSLDKLVVLPDRYGIRPSVSGREATFRLENPCDISFEPDGCNSPLLLFTNSPEVSSVPEHSPDVIYFGPGIHNPQDGLIRLTSNQTLYLASGAIVNAGVEATGDNITICGRGILDGSDWDHNAGPTDFMINAKSCNNLVIKDIIVKGSYYWTIVPQHCDRVLIDHVRLVGSRVGNDDGVDPCNSSNVMIRNCFFRTDDDAISPKGITRAGGEGSSKITENIVVENCVFWVDFANVFRIATESSCPMMANFTARNIDVIHFPDRDRVQIFWLHPTGEMPMENLAFEHIRIHAEKPYHLIKISPSTTLVGTRPIIQPTPNDKTIGPGRRGIGSRGYGEFVVVPSSGPYVHNVVFRDITSYGCASGGDERGAVIIQGVDSQHDVSGIVLDHVEYGGTLVDDRYPMLRMNEHVHHVRFMGNK